MHTVGEYIGAQKTVEGELIVSFAVDDDVLDKIESLEGEQVVLDVQKFSDKRSNQANRYFWEMATAIGNALGVSKDTIYEMKLKEYGVWVDYEIPKEAVKTFSELFKFTVPQYYYSTDRVTEMGEIEPMGMVCLRCYKGSHLYNTKEMSNLINGTVNDAKDLGIETRTPQEIEQALSYWEAYSYENGKN